MAALLHGGHGGCRHLHVCSRYLTRTHERADEEQHGPELGHALMELLVRGNVAEHGDLHLG